MCLEPLAMATSTASKHKSSKKRKLPINENTEKPSKLGRYINNIEEEEEEEYVVEEKEGHQNMEEQTGLKSKGVHQWRNLELVVSIQSKQLDVYKKVDLVFNFVNSRANKVDSDTEDEFNTLSMSQSIMYISNWIQSVLIMSEKKIQARDKEYEGSQLCLDYRCWVIFKFCLEESSRLQVSLNLSRDLLKVISCVARSALTLLETVNIDNKESIFAISELQFFNIVNDCVEFLFSSLGRLLNGNLETWAVAVSSLMEVVIKVYGDNLQDNDVGILMTRFSCLVFDPFSKFLRVHPCRKNGFRDFVDKLLEPLLHLLVLLHDEIKGNNLVLQQNLIKFIEEIMSYGFFHPVHLDEYLTFHSTEKYSSSADGNSENARTIIKSYHRHLFDKLEVLISERKIQALSGIGKMFSVFVTCVKKHKRDSLKVESSRVMESQSIKHLPKTGNLTSEKSHDAKIDSSDMRKAIFDFFVLTMDPLLLDLNENLQLELQMGTSLLNVYHDIKSVNELLSVMMHERVYARMEGNFGTACSIFFKKIYGVLLSCYAKFNELWQTKFDMARFLQEIFNSVAKQFIFVVANFLEIEYELIGDDLFKTWLMVLTFITMSHSSEDVSLLLETIDLGCQMLNLYSELRQVNHAISTLCRGLRYLSFYPEDDERSFPALMKCNSVLRHNKFAKSCSLLLCSQRFRLAITNAIKSIPEGQVNGCVKTLTDDILVSLAWMRLGYSVTDELEIGDARFCKFATQAEIFGMVLSEIYSRVLDSLTVTTGNSYLVGVSIKNLIAVLHDSISHLIGLEQDSADIFFFSVTQITLRSNKLECKKYFQEKIPLIILFFFRLHISCRSLYRQALSLMPPDSSKKMSAAMADFYTAYSGQESLERVPFKDDSYFSWINQTSVSLLCVMQYIKDNFFQEGYAGNSCLICVMHIMTIQRLVDLNRHIQSLEYIVCRNENVLHSDSVDDDDLSMLRDNKRKQKKLLLAFKKEAICLTSFIMDHIQLIDEKQFLSEISSGGTAEISSPDTWDLAICTVNEKTLATAIWWIICQHVDTWCNYATKKKLKVFLKHLILLSLPHVSCGQLEKLNLAPSEGSKVTKQQISREHLCDTVFYDQRFVRRYMGSKLCDVLKKCILLLFKDFTNIDAELSSSDLVKVSCVLNNLSTIPQGKPVTCSTCDELIEGCCDQQASFSPISSQVAACQRVLDLLYQLMERSLSFKSASRCLLYLVNFERLVVERLLDSHGSLCLHQHHDLLGLLVSCRRALKHLLMTFCDDKLTGNNSPILPVFSESSSTTLWLLKSVNLVVAWWDSLSPEPDGGHVNDMISSLMDHTSYVSFTIGKHLFGLATQSVLIPKSTRISDSCMKSPNDVEARKCLADAIEILEDQTKNCLLSLKESFTSGILEGGVQLTYMNKLCSIINCTHGFLWGVESALDDLCSNDSDLKAKIMKRKQKTISRLNKFVEMLIELIAVSSQIFLHSDQPPQTSCEGTEILDSDHDKDVLKTDQILHESPTNKDGHSEPGKMSLTSSHVQSDMDTGIKKRKSQVNDGGLTEFGSFNLNCLRIDLLQSFLSCQNLESAFLLRGLLIASSAIVKLNMLIGCSPLPSNLVQIFLGSSEVLLTKFLGIVSTPKLSAFVWLDGTLKFLESLGSQFPSTNPVTTRDVYTKLVELHLKAIGRCISLQGKGATLISHDFESSTKFGTRQVSDSALGDSLNGIDQLKAKLRISFKVFIEKSSELHLSSTIQTVEKALLYKVEMGSACGGTVSSVAAAGVDCFDLILEFAKGQKRMDLVGRNINSLIASLLNIVVHLQGPNIFYRNPDTTSGNKNPDSGSVVLMCVEVLTRVTGKPALFSMDPHHVALSLRIPAMLFQDFHTLNAVKSSYPTNLEKFFLVDGQFSVSLYAASCRLLWTVVKHHKSKCIRCIALLQSSLQALLHCLELVNGDSAERRNNFTWNVEEGVKCASYLRRVYEEIRQQKDVFGRHCFMLLSDYVWVYSGYGSQKKGIKREVDEALRPGVYALIDVCSADDLQYLHTLFGEGPCRSTLASLQHDYKRHFQYEGKV